MAYIRNADLQKSDIDKLVAKLGYQDITHNAKGYAYALMSTNREIVGWKELSHARLWLNKEIAYHKADILAAIDECKRLGWDINYENIIAVLVAHSMSLATYEHIKSVVKSYNRQAEKQLKELKQEASKLEPCACGYDDCQDIAPVNNDELVATFQEMRELKKEVEQLKEEMDNLLPIKLETVCLEGRPKEVLQVNQTGCNTGDGTVVVNGRTRYVRRGKFNEWFEYFPVDLCSCGKIGCEHMKAISEDIGVLVAIQGSDYLRHAEVNTSDYMTGYIRRDGKTIPVRAYDGLGLWFEKGMEKDRENLNNIMATRKVLK